MSTAAYAGREGGRGAAARGTPADDGAALAVRVGQVLGTELAGITRDLQERLADDIEELPRDDGLLQLLSASIEANVDTILHMLQHQIGIERTQAPVAATEYSRRLAQRGIPVNALVRAYRLGQDSFLRWCLQEVRRQSSEATAVSEAALQIVATTSAYIDWVTQEVVSVYEEEHQLWILNRSASRLARIRELLAGPIDDGGESGRGGDPVADAENTLGYRLRQQHVGLVLTAVAGDARDDQLTYLERSVIALAERLGCAGRPLFAPCDELSAWAWLPLGSQRLLEPETVSSAVAGWERTVRVGFGSPCGGVRGFRRSHQQARQADLVARSADPPLPTATAYDDVGAIALMCHDLDAARDWVAETLGGLARPGEANARLRDTAREFLAAGGSYTAAAERLQMHKNSVVYRLRKAEEALGRSLRSDRQQVETALELSHWLGKTVLVADGETG